MKLLAVLAGLAALSSSAYAQTVVLTETTNNLYDTGLATNGTNLSVSSTDPHYTLVTNPAGTGPNALVATPNAAWVANQTGTNPPSSWISVVSSGSTSEPVGNYDYQLTLSNIPTGKVVTISGLVAADNTITINANGVSKYSNLTNSYASLLSFSFTFNSAASNVLDFVVNNSGSAASPTGLQVNNLAGSYTPVPEAKDMAAYFLISGCLLIAFGRMRKLFSC